MLLRAAFLAPSSLPSLPSRVSRLPFRGATCRLPRPRLMKVAVVGCAHGELDAIYAALAEAEAARGVRADVLLCAGDFQAVRNAADLASMACPPRFRDMRSFWRYYAGDARAPLPTLFVGGNHEASTHLQEIPLGGLVAPNIYFLGNAGVVNFRGLRIAGVSGVYTEHNFHKHRFESPPYPRSQIKSVYHARREDVDRLLRLRAPVDVFLSHDWPRGITDFGDLAALLRAKPFLKGEIADGSFGNPASRKVLDALAPSFWFAAHIHVKFPALVHHDSGKTTRFLALDKALPKRDFIQILDIPVEEGPPPPGRGVRFEKRQRADGEAEAEAESAIELDPEWLTILRTEAEQRGRQTPVSEEEMHATVQKMQASGVKPFLSPINDFERRAAMHDPKGRGTVEQGQVVLQKENKSIMAALGLPEDAWLAKQQIAQVNGAQAAPVTPVPTG